MDSLDKLTIETPEQTQLEFALAGVGSRFLALALDTLLQFGAVAALVILWVVFARGLRFWPQAWTWTAALLVLLFFLLYAGYFAFFEAIWNGQTPGKRYAHLRVIKDGGRPITVYEAIARNLVRLVDQLPGIYAVGIVSALLSRENKRLGDYVAGTVVVHEKPFERERPIWEIESTQGASLYDTARLSAEEMQLVEAFLLRRPHLEPVVRSRTAQQIAERLAKKLEVAPGNRPPDEAFLETLLRERRTRAAYRRP